MNTLQVSAFFLVSTLAGWMAVDWCLPAPPVPARRALIPDDVRVEITAHLPPANIASLTRDLLRPGHPEAEPAVALQLAKQIAPADFAKSLNEIRTLTGPAKGVFQRAVVRRWLTVDPAAAVTWCLGHDWELTSEAMKEWTRLDAAAAQSFITRLPRERRDQAVSNIAETMASIDPAAVPAFIKRVGTEFDEGRLIPALEKLASQDPQELLKSAETLQPVLRHRARTVAASAMAVKDLNGAIAWAQAQPDHQMILEGLFSANLPPASVLPAFAALSGEQRHLVLNASGDSWGFHDPEAFLKALPAAAALGITEQELSSSITSAVGRLNQDGPQESLAAFHQLLPDQPDLWAREFVIKWAQTDPAAARAWVEKLPDESLRERAVQYIDGYQEVRHYEETLGAEFASSFEHFTASSHTTRDPTPIELQKILSSHSGTGLSQGTGEESDIRQNFPSDYAHWLASEAPSENTNNRISEFIREWSPENPSAAAAWLVTLPDSDGKKQGLHDAIRQWRSLAPQQARQWAESLPEGTERQSVLDILGPLPQ
jgi:hypothetical protein